MRHRISLALAGILACAAPAAHAQSVEVLLAHRNEVRAWEAGVRDYIAAVADWERSTGQKMADAELRPNCAIVARHRVQRRMNNALAGIPSLQLNRTYTATLTGAALAEEVKERTAARRCDALSVGS